MTTTTRTAVADHTLIRRTGARPGSWHAALPEDTGWRTACGELLVDSERGTIAPLTAEQAHALLADLERHPQPVCRRCDRVGASVQP